MGISPIVSVIVPVYNVEHYLQEALDSVIHQSYSNLEIVIIDDGSTDKSYELCDSYARNDKRIRVIHQKNQGLSSARNRGLDAITGDYVVFLDSDDAYHKDYVKSMIDVIIRENADIVMCKYSINSTTGELMRHLNEITKPLASEGLLDHDSALRALANDRINASVWNKLYKRELWKERRFPEGVVYEDLFTVFRIIDSCNRIYVIDRCLYFYRKRPGSITETSSWKNVCDRFSACCSIYSFIEKYSPSIFQIEHLLKWKRRQQTCVVEMIRIYFRQLENGTEKIQLRELQKKIIELEHEIGLGPCSARIRIMYLLTHLNPTVLILFCVIHQLFAKK